MFSFGEDIMRYLEYEDDKDECETSQWLIGMKDLFRGCIVKVWFGIDMSSDIHRSANKVIVRKCVEFYAKCWKHRNEAYHDKEKQKIRIKNWLRKEKEMAMQSENAQVREYANVFKINEDRSDIEKIKKWIMNLKKLQSKVEKVKRNDIRNYMLFENV